MGREREGAGAAATVRKKAKTPSDGMVKTSNKSTEVQYSLIFLSSNLCVPVPANISTLLFNASYHAIIKLRAKKPPSETSRIFDEVCTFVNHGIFFLA